MTEPTIEEVTKRETMRLAGISTAAFGYWKVGDSIHPDYDTQALRDVADLYQKYDKLYNEIQSIRSQPVPVEPVTFDHFTNGDSRDDFGPVVDGRYVLKSDYDALLTQLQAAQQERDDANDKALRVLRGNFTQICSYCGWEANREGAQWADLQSHIKQCNKHPLVQSESRNKRLAELLKEIVEPKRPVWEVSPEGRKKLAEYDELLREVGK